MLGLADLVDTIQTFGARTFIQMNPGLGIQGSALSRGVHQICPSTIGYKANGDTGCEKYLGLC